MSFYISICTDLNALIATGLVDEESPLRGMIDGRSGNYVCHNFPIDPTESMIIISSLEGLEEIEALDYITITTPEVVFGTKNKRLTRTVIYCGGRTTGCSHRHTLSPLITG